MVGYREALSYFLRFLLGWRLRLSSCRIYPVCLCMYMGSTYDYISDARFFGLTDTVAHSHDWIFFFKKKKKFLRVDSCI